MPTLPTKVEAQLKMMNGDVFAKLMHRYYNKKDYGILQAPGSVVARDKSSKGTPDIAFYDGDSYTFIECTTKDRIGKGQSLIKKLRSDIEHCFNTKKLGVKPKDISKVILAFNQKISRKEELDLQKLSQSFNPNCKFEAHGIQHLATDLCNERDILFDEFRLVQSTGQILTIKDYKERSAKGLQPKITNKFIDNNGLLDSLEKAVLSNEIVLISGRAGTGKSKTALALLEKFEESKLYETRIIVSSDVLDIHSDFSNEIEVQNKYVLLFDDANNATANFERVLLFLKQKRSGGIKLLVTVRDYAQSNVVSLLREVPYLSFKLPVYNDEQIARIIETAAGTKRPMSKVFLDRLLLVANKNPRLGIMAMEAAWDDPETPLNPVMIYDKYFEKVKSEISILHDEIYLKVLGAISFFGVVGKQDERIRNIVVNILAINWKLFWNSVQELNKHEFVDLHKGGIVKVTDQVFSNYMFFKCFLDADTKVLPYSTWGKHILVEYPSQSRSTLIDACNTFGFYTIQKTIKPELLSLLPSFASSSKEYTFFQIYGYFLPLRTLKFVKDWTQSMPEQRGEVRFDPKHNEFISNQRYIELLTQEWVKETEWLKTAIKLGFDIALKDYSKVPMIVHYLRSSFSFSRYDHNFAYRRQHIFVETFAEILKGQDQKQICWNIFLRVVEKFFVFEGTDHSSSDGDTMVFHRFTISLSKGFKNLRTQVLNILVEEASIDQVASIEWMERYIRCVVDSHKELLENEALVLKKFIQQYCEKTNFYHSFVITSYLKRLDSININILKEQNPIYYTDDVSLYELFTIERSLYKGKSSAEVEKLKEVEAKEYLRDLNESEQVEIITRVDAIGRALKHKNNYWIEQAIYRVFKIWSETAPTIFLEASKSLLKFSSYDLSKSYILSLGLEGNLVSPKAIYSNLISIASTPISLNWKYNFFLALPQSKLDIWSINELVKILSQIKQNTDAKYDFGRLNQFIKYDKLFDAFKVGKEHLKDHNIITYLVESVMRICDSTKWYYYQSLEELIPFFKDNSELLRKFYTLNKKGIGFFDSTGEVLQKIVELDPCFPHEHFIHRLEKEDHVYIHDWEMPLIDFWLQSDAEQIADRIIELLVEKYPVYSSIEHLANVLFAERAMSSDTSFRAEAYISNFIKTHFRSLPHISIIMNIALYSFSNKFLNYFKELLLANTDVSVLSDVYLMQSSAFFGDVAPYYEREKELYQSIIDMIKGLSSPLDYIEHIDFFEQRLLWLDKRLEEEQKTKFIGHRFL